MTNIYITKFVGEVPRSSERLLNENSATTAENTKLFSGKLAPWKEYGDAVQLAKAGTIQSIYRIDDGAGTDYWFHWPEVVDVVKSPVAGLTGDARRWYFTGAGSFPQVTQYDHATANDVFTGAGGAAEYPIGSYKLGVPKPASAPTVTPVAPDAAVVTTTRAYVYTYVTVYGEEGPPSDYTLDTGPNKSGWGVGGIITAQPDANRSIATVRIYRTLTGDTSSNFYFVKEISFGTASTTDTVDDTGLAEILTSTSYDEPPATMHSIIAMPNGVCAALNDNEILFSEPYKPWAWPEKYRLSTDYIGVGLGAFGNTLAVMTEGNPYIVTGIHPETMSMKRLEEYEACVSKRSIVPTNAGVLYASNNGLMLVNSGGARNATRQFYTRDEWQVLLPNQFYSARYDNRYFSFNGGRGVIIDQGEPQIGATQVTSNVGDGIWTDPETDKLYVVNSSQVREWDEDDNAFLTYTWQSKDFIEPRPLNFGCIQMEADFGVAVDVAALLAALQAANAPFIANGTGGPINGAPVNGFALGASALRRLNTSGLAFANVDIYADGTLQWSGTPTSRTPLRLPSGYKATRWAIRITGNIPIHSVIIAETIKELQRTL